LLLYFEGKRGKALEASYKGSGIEKQKIPPEVLFNGGLQ